MGNCKFCKIAGGNHGNIMGIYRKKGFLKGGALRLLRTKLEKTLNKANETLNEATL